MAGLTSGLLGGIISTLLIVILGEILPQVNQRTKTPQVLYHKPGGARDTPMLSHSVVDTQAACSRHGLFIGANALWLVKLFIIIMFPVAWPISLVLDRVRPSSPVSPCVTSSSCPSTCLGCLSSERGRLVGAHALSLTSTLSLSMLSHWAQVLGREIGTVYNSAELKKLINIHVENPDAAEESGLTAQDQRLLTGALSTRTNRCAPLLPARIPSSVNSYW
jgi:metal transporter CNNM